MPRGLTVTEVTDTSVSLRWNRPETDGGKPITRYIVEKRDPAKSTYIRTYNTLCRWKIGLKNPSFWGSYRKLFKPEITKFRLFVVKIIAYHILFHILIVTNS